MNDNMPEIDSEEKKEKKRGLFGWLRARLGIGSRGAVGRAGINPSAMNVGRALGTAKFGASAGFGAFLSGNIGVIATAVMMAVAGGVYLANNGSVPGGGSAFSSGNTSDGYIPAILRRQAANQGSSLDMFKDANKNGVDTGDASGFDENGYDKDGYDREGYDKDGYDREGYDKNGYDKEGYDKEGYNASGYDKNGYDRNGYDKDGYDKNGYDSGGGQNPNQANGMGQGMAAKMQSGSLGSLSSSLGGGAGKISSMGLDGKSGQGKAGAQPGFGSGKGAGSSGAPKISLRKGNMLAMKGNPRAVASNSKSGKGIGAALALKQAKGLRDTQQTYSGGGLAGERSTQDKAWEGNTQTGAMDGDSDGGAGIKSGTVGGTDTGGTPAGSTIGGGGTVPGSSDPGTYDTSGVPTSDPTGTGIEVPAVNPPTETTAPWTEKMNQALTCILLAGALALIASILVKCVLPWVVAIGWALAAGAALLGGYAMVLGAQIIGMGQHMLGTFFMIGGAVAVAAAGMAAFGVCLGPITAAWMAAGALGIGLAANMLEPKTVTASEGEAAKTEMTQKLSSDEVAKAKAEAGVTATAD